MFFQKKIVTLSLILFILSSCGIKKPIIKPNSLPQMQQHELLG